MMRMYHFKREGVREVERLKERVLDACCGGRAFWFDKNNQDTIYMDIREVETVLCDGRTYKVKPDIIADFREMPFNENSFNLVVFDPPHIDNLGEKSYMSAKYGRLNPDTWREDLRKGFTECWRVLKHGGTLIFKWNETRINLKEVLQLFPQKPMFGSRGGTKGKTFWIVYYKSESE